MIPIRPRMKEIVIVILLWSLLLIAVTNGQPMAYIKNGQAKTYPTTSSESPKFYSKRTATMESKKLIIMIVTQQASKPKKDLEFLKNMV